MEVISALSLFRVGRSAMAAHERSLDVISNNIANVNTTGFGRSRVEFKEVLEDQAGTDTSGVTADNVRRIWSQGVVRNTGRPLDLAIQGHGFFQIALPDGRTGYTRDGTFLRASNGALVTADGYAVVPGLVIPDDATDYRLNPDGTLMVQRAGADTWTEMGRLQLATFANPEGLEHTGRGIYVAGEASGAAQLAAPGEDTAGQLVAGAIEESTVDLGEEMVELITAQRLYALGLKIVQTADEMQGLANQLIGR